MRAWIALAAKLYPRRWRERYGAEFDALMEDVEPDGRELANVLILRKRSGTRNQGGQIFEMLGHNIGERLEIIEQAHIANP
jgi:hypothetical protein